MKITAEPRSDQWNSDDFIVGGKTFTIKDVKPGAAEQKYDIELAEGEGRVWRPPVTVVRILLGAWGDESDHWIGRRVTLYRDETVKFGREATGGIRISHMSNLPGNKTYTIKLTSSRGQKETHRIEPLPDAPPPAPTITPEAVEDFQRAIEEAATDDDLSNIAADLKNWDLGPHKARLQTAWKNRAAAIKQAAPEQGELTEAGQ